MSDLFRREVIEERQRGGLGRIRLVRPLSSWWLLGLVVCTLLAVVAFLTLAEYTRKARVGGVLVPDLGVIRLVSPQTATVVESHASEGRQVRQGEVLFVLSVDPALPAGDARVAVRSSLAARQRSLQAASHQHEMLEHERLAALDRQIEDMRRELAQMGAESELQAQRLGLANAAQARLESLRLENFISSAQVQAKSEDVLALRAQAQALERQRTNRGRELAGLQAQRREVPFTAGAARGDIERDLAALAQQSAEIDALEAAKRIVVRAPQDGTLSAVLALPGHSVDSSAALASLLPAGARLQAHLFAPSSAIGFVRAGQPVLLRYQAFPYQKFGHQAGQVTLVSRAALQANETAGLPLPGTARTGAEPLYRITVTLEQQSIAAYGQPQALAPGMQLDADVQLDRRRLIEWMFEPILGMAGRV